ncbi:hydroxyectoine utilization dehydratase EutB [Sedimentimonas flavescens]|uniref:hydroxyectoine utilization dehydratase EutB n=1 Tax=Sedimentimonas flavescens TaxID=2851012 RepID=UPI001C49ED3E|nr:hydroxyectoine utilization dehydratase EutB [Sedimentimonas flavescens]MBW0159549.1 hydroxyectoine utilization dehydratase EutB [Sedimentimonas flavescens]
MNAPATVKPEDIRAARTRIAGKVLRTPMVEDPQLGALLGVPVFLKLEHRQTTGAFKLRGATNALLSLTPAQRARGVVTASTGNHGRALAQAARSEGVRAVVCLSRLVPANKVAAVRALGAEVRIVGDSQDEAMQEVARAVRDEGLSEIAPFDDAAVIAGQGTLGFEIIEDCPEAHTLLVPLSGGGLAAGVALALKASNPDARIVGISMARGAAMAASLTAGHPVQVPELPTLADSLGGGIGLANRFTYPMCKALLDQVVLLDEAEIAAGIRHIHKVTGDAVEGAAAVGVAALIAGKIIPESPTVALLTGANIDAALHAQIMSGALPQEVLA